MVTFQKSENLFMQSTIYVCVCVWCVPDMRFEPNNEFNSVLFHLSSLSNCSFCSSFLSSSFFLWFLLNSIFATTILLFTPARVCNSFQVCVGRKNIFTPLPEFNPVGRGEAPPPPQKNFFICKTTERTGMILTSQIAPETISEDLKSLIFYSPNPSWTT